MTSSRSSSTSVTLVALRLVAWNVTGPAGTVAGDGVHASSVTSMATFAAPALAPDFALAQPAAASPTRTRTTADRNTADLGMVRRSFTGGTGSLRWWWRRARRWARAAACGD